MMHYWSLLWDWNTLDSVRTVHSFLEGGALVFFGLLVLFDVLAHFAEDNKSRAKKLEKMGLICFAVAVFSEGFAYPYSRRNDTLASRQDTEQRAKIAALDNSTQGLRTDADNARKQTEGFRAQIADSSARVKAAEAQVATAMAASAGAVSKIAAADARSAEASAKAEGFRLDVAKAQESAAKAGAQAAEAQLALEKFKAPRTLSAEQQQQMKDMLSHFPDTPYELAVDPEPEANDLIIAIDTLLRASGWTYKGSAIGGLLPGLVLPSGSYAEELYFSGGVVVAFAKASIALNTGLL